MIKQTEVTRSSHIIKALEAAYNDIRSLHPDTAPAIIVVYYSERARGHIWFDSWTVTGTGEKVDEIHINSILLFEGPESTLQTLLHEAIHSINRTRGIQDCSRQNQYHNKFFAATAQEVGLVLGHDKTIGIITTGITPETKETYHITLDNLKSCLTIYQEPLYKLLPKSTNDPDEDEEEGEPEEPKKNRQIKAVCPCGRIIRASRKVFEAAEIMCVACLGNFKIQE